MSQREIWSWLKLKTSYLKINEDFRGESELFTVVGKKEVEVV